MTTHTNELPLELPTSAEIPCLSLLYGYCYTVSVKRLVFLSGQPVNGGRR